MPTHRRAPGSIHQITLPSGAVRYVAELSRQGKKQSKRCTSRREAEATIRAWVAAPPPMPVSRQTFATFAARWLAETVRISTKSGTYRAYEHHLRVQVLPTLGALPLVEITPQRVQALQTALLARYAPATVNTTMAVLGNCLAEAERYELIPRNPVARVRRARVPRAQPAAMSATEARAILAAVRGTRVEVAVTLALLYGCRLGEATGVRWGDVGTETVSVAGQLTRGGYAPTKRDVTHTFPILTLVRAALQRQRVRQAEDRLYSGPAWVETGYVSTRPDGRPLPHTAPGAGLARALREAGLRPRTFHELRHGTASLLAALGIHPSVVAKILGHSTPALTLSVYTHTSTEQVSAALHDLERVLEG